MHFSFENLASPLSLIRSHYDKPLGSPEHPLVMRFSADAQEIFREWMQKIFKEAKENNLSESLQAHLLKMPKTIVSLALIFELTEGGRFEINKDALQTALRWEKYLLSHVKRLYAAADSLATEGTKLIVEPCDHLPDVFTLRDIHQRSWISLTDNRAVKQALELLCRSNHIRQIASENSSQGGRPTIRYEWHPFVKNNSIKQ